MEPAGPAAAAPAAAAGIASDADLDSTVRSDQMPTYPLDDEHYTPTTSAEKTTADVVAGSSAASGADNDAASRPVGGLDDATPATDSAPTLSLVKTSTDPAGEPEVPDTDDGAPQVPAHDGSEAGYEQAAGLGYDEDDLDPGETVRLGSDEHLRPLDDSLGIDDAERAAVIAVAVESDPDLFEQSGTGSPATTPTLRLRPPRDSRKWSRALRFGYLLRSPVGITTATVGTIVVLALVAVGSLAAFGPPTQTMDSAATVAVVAPQEAEFVIPKLTNLPTVPPTTAAPSTSHAPKPRKPVHQGPTTAHTAPAAAASSAPAATSAPGGTTSSARPPSSTSAKPTSTKSPCSTRFPILATLMRNFGNCV